MSDDDEVNGIDFHAYVRLRAEMEVQPDVGVELLSAKRVTANEWRLVDAEWRRRIDADDKLEFGFRVFHEHFTDEAIERLPRSQRAPEKGADPPPLPPPEPSEPLRAAQLPSYLQRPVPKVENAPIAAPAQEERTVDVDETQLPTRTHQPALPFLPGTGPAQPPKTEAIAEVEDRSGQTVGLYPVRAQPTLPFQVQRMGLQPEPTVMLDNVPSGSKGGDVTVGLEAPGARSADEPVLPFKQAAAGTKAKAREVRMVPQGPEPTMLLSAHGSPGDGTVMLHGDEHVNAAPDVPFVTNDDGNLSLDQFMRLQAELTVWPEEAQAIYAEYGLADEARRQRVQRTWRQRRETDSQVELYWSSSFTPLRIRLRNHKQSGKARRDAP